MAPVKLWELDSSGAPSSVISTGVNTSFGGEEYRAIAENLDRQIDSVLDAALSQFERLKAQMPEKRVAFLRAWAVGRVVATAHPSLLESEAMQHEERFMLWSAMARKCRLGVRSDGSSCHLWKVLRPELPSEPKRARRDIFEVGLWLQEQSIEEALVTFCGSIHNANEIHRRPAIRSLKIRQGIFRWLSKQTNETREILSKTKSYVILAKKLSKRWPAKGPGSAKSPTHYAAEYLDIEIEKVLDSEFLIKNRLPAH